jgi:L-lactate dehydrogenase complex protein LldG
MSSHSRERIMARLRASGTERTEVPEAPFPAEAPLDREERIERLTERMSTMRTEVHRVDREDWVEKLKELAREKGWKQLLYGPGSPVGSDLERAWPSGEGDLPALVAYNEEVEGFKEAIFQIDAGVTGTRGAVADTGAVVLWPTPAEPRLMSLVPPVHVAVLDADTVYDSLAAMMTAENWAAGMPTNALLVSGPSKTADIEFTLVFGVHGPKELVLLIRTEGDRHDR